MNARIRIAAPTLVILALLVAGGGGDDSNNASSSPTLAPACSASDLSGGLASLAIPANTAYYQLDVSNTSRHNCSVSGPPAVHLLDSSGNVLDIQIAVGTDCAPTSTNFGNCIQQMPVALSAGGATPVFGSVPGQLSVTLAVDNIEFIAPCSSPALQAHFGTLEFPGIGTGLRIDLPIIDLQTCAPQVRLHGFGPVTPEGSPTPTATP